MTDPNPNPTPSDPPVDDTALAAAAKADPPAADPKAGDPPAGDPPADPKADPKAGDPDPKADPKAGDPPVGAPDSYDVAAFQMPEGVEFDKDGFEAVAPTLKDLNLTQDQAGKLVGVYAEKVVPLIQSRTLKAIDDQGAELRATMARELQDDKEVGGKNLPEAQSFAAKAIAHFIPDAKEREGFSKFLNESGFGNQRYLMRIISGAGRVISEATTVAGDKAHVPASEAEKFYGKG